MSTITKLSPDVTQYYKNITSPIDANARIQWDVQVWTVQKGAHEIAGDAASQPRGARMGLELQLVCPLRRSELSPQQEDPLQSKLRDLDMRIQRSQNSPASGDAKARWRAKIIPCYVALQTWLYHLFLSQLHLSGFTSNFRFYDYYIIPVHVLPFHLYSIPPVSCSYLIISWVVPLDITCYTSTCPCMLMLMTQFF